MCVDRVHAGVTKWIGKIPPEQTDQQGSSCRGEAGDRGTEEQAKGKKTTMKKLMIVAAAAAMSFAAKAELKWENCPECAGEGVEESECTYEVFKVTGSGKAVVFAKKGAYKTVGKLQVKKGALALEGSDPCGTGDCCYDAGVLFATVKAGKNTFRVKVPVDVKVWSAFGKNYDLVKDDAWRNLSKAKKIKLESALYIASNSGAELDPADDVTNDLEDFELYASAFGKVTFKVYSSKSSKTICGKDETGCGYEIIIKNYKGWFVGLYKCIDEDACFTCDCGLDTYGGTWKATYSSKSSTTNLSAAQKLAGTSFSDDE